MTHTGHLIHIFQFKKKKKNNSEEISFKIIYFGSLLRNKHKLGNNHQTKRR